MVSKRRSKSQTMAKNSNLSQVLYLLAEIQKHLRNGRINHELSQIVKHTRDREILEYCHRAATCIDVELDINFHKLDNNQHRNSLRILVNHLKWAKDRMDEVIELMSECEQEWVESTFLRTQAQLLALSNYFILLEKVPDITDLNGEVIKAGDLVAITCQDEQEREYDHYGVIIATAHGFRIAHFFTGATVKGQNTLVEKGFGYIHELEYSPDWIIKEHLPLTMSYDQVQMRIKESKLLEKRIWNKLTYNCEHWAREMFSGTPECTQLQKWREEIKNNRKT